ncbi:ROK family transcriptional regulator [Streptomyces sp. NRRL S-87]|uniref:ROK family transcriptional regulator n=1 Tax=Streptomyces sp. NRRL S-87 TaxID=1463920 RepID=UPI0007C4C9A0|nr:ROK family transcriptional regulator [Streptomyces sp. NRRL S-87]
MPVLRGHNDALVLRLLREAGGAGASRLELAGRTGLTPQAVSKITARLRADGLVAEAGRRASTGGKPQTLLRLVPEAAYAVGVQLDRDEFRAVRVDLAGRAVAERVGSLDFGAGPDAVVEVAAREVEGLAGAGAAGRVLGVGVAAPGPLDHRSGVLGRVTGFPAWEGVALRDALVRRLAAGGAGLAGVPVVLDKDTNAGALGAARTTGAPPAGTAGAEGMAGTAGPSGTEGPRPDPAGPRSGLPVPDGPDDAGSFAYLHVGTGLGAGIVLGGALHRGPRTGAGEFGHQVLQLDGPRCACGARGCAEALCLEAVGRADPDRAARVLGAAAANLVALLDVDRVVLGGRVVAEAPDAFVRGVAEVLAERALGAYVVPVALAPGGAVARGAAELVLGGLFGGDALGDGG